MGACFLYGNGGGSDLNFTLVGGTAQPESPKENTIWVKTDAAISMWHFRSEANPPWAAPEGTVIITSSTVPVGTYINVIKETQKFNAIYLQLLGCIQYSAGAWQKREAYVYKGGVWVQFSLLALPYFYNAGDFTVEWLGYGSNSGGVLTVTGGSASSGTFEGYFVIPDIHNYKTISCYISSYTNVKPTVSIRKISDGTTVASAKPSSAGSTVSIDVSSLSGNDYYFVLSTNSTWDDAWVVSNVKTTKIWGDAR